MAVVIGAGGAGNVQQVRQAAQYGLSTQEYNLLKYGYDMEMEAVDKQLAAERANMATANAFSASEAEKNRQFQQSSADKEMQFSADQAELARIFSREEAQADRDWQEYMSSTAYQRAVSDLQAAGINPLLAVSNGGAATGSGAMGQTSQAYGARANGSAATAFKASAQKADIATIAKQAMSLLSDKLDRHNSYKMQEDYLKTLVKVTGMYNDTARETTSMNNRTSIAVAGINALGKTFTSLLKSMFYLG